MFQCQLPQINESPPQMQSKVSDDTEDSKKKERAERARRHTDRETAIRQRLEEEIPVASPKELSRLWHNSVELLSTYPDGQASTAIWVLWETSLRLAALAQKHGTPHDNLVSIRAATIGLPGDVAKITYLFSQDPTLVEIRNRASVEITRLLIALPDLGNPQPPAAAAPQSRGGATLGHGGPGKTFDALCEFLLKAQPQQELRAGCRVSLAQAKAACAAEEKANDYLSPKGRLCTSGWIRRDGKFIELTEKGADEAASRAAKRMEKRGRESSSGS